MGKLFNDEDGANYQARAVLAYLRGHDGLEVSYDQGKYLAEPEIARWHNCREQGYVISLHNRSFDRQLNIAFFEHRNSDEICAIEWEQRTLNPPTIETLPENAGIYKDKYDVSHRETVGRASEMADWIYERLEAFWLVSNKPKVIRTA